MNNWKEKILGILKKKDSNQKRSLVCGACGQNKKRRYCKFCKKETSNVHSIEITETVVVKDSIGLKQKRFGVKGWISEMFHGYRDSIKKDKFPEGVNLHRRIDRENDWYDEVVKDEKTGKIINECHEPLSAHVGHGSAKK